MEELELLKQILAAQIAQVAILQSIQAHVASHSWERLSPEDLLEMNPTRRPGFPYERAMSAESRREPGE